MGSISDRQPPRFFFCSHTAPSARKVARMRLPLDDILRRAAGARATSVLLLAGQKPVVRVGRELQPPIDDAVLTFHDTQAYAEDILGPGKAAGLEHADSFDVPFDLAGVRGRATIFYAQGAHSVVLYLEAPR
jgi:Tfp pilus assembly pilus retraction ATPase PilT